MHCERGLLRICDDIYDLHSYSSVLVVSLGKAGHTMVEALSHQVGGSLQGVVASSVQPATQVHGFRYFRGGHPTPNAESIRAASAMLRALESQPASALVIFLLSGGGSSIVEKPIDDEISLDDLIATYRALVLSGATIAEINTIRKHLSAVKGGRLAQAASPAQQVSLLVSDVPDNTPGRARFRSDDARFDHGRGLLSPRGEVRFAETVSAIDAANCSIATRWRRRQSRTIRRFIARAGGQC